MVDIENFFSFMTKTGSYTIFNTLLYSTIYILSFLILGFLIKNKKIFLDKYFNINLTLSFTIITLIRVAMDFSWIKEMFLFYTPYMQILVLSLFSVNILNGNKKKDLFYFYLILLLVTIIFFVRRIPNFFIFFLIPILFAIMLIFYKEKKEKFYLLPILSQSLDGFFGNLGIYIFNYAPKHVLHRLILNYFALEYGILVFLILKFSILFLTIFVIKKFIYDEVLKEVLYLMLFYVGYNAGLRNSLLVILNEI
ncbi:MAG: DUF63 family protein [Nanopusillaceae archaeon]